MRTNLVFITIMLYFFSLSGTSWADDKEGDALCTEFKYKEYIKTHEISEYALLFKIAGKKSLFEDIGCAAKWRDKQCSSRQGAFDSSAFVYDFYSKSKISALTANYVKSAKVESPNGYEIVAFAVPAEAEKFLAENGGEILTYDELMQR